jgi:lysyl-tRNA synthetase class 1
MNDKERIERARAALLALHGEAMSEKRLWMFAYDRLIKDRRAGLTDEERQSLIDDLESVVKRASCTAPRSFDPHDVKDAAERLIKHYERTKSTDQIKRLHAHVGHAFEHFGGLGSATLGSTVLQTAVQSYQSAGMTSDHDRARRSMENKIAQAGEETTAITTEFRITREDMDQFLAKIVVEELTQTIVNIAGTFLSNRRELEALVQQSMKESPVQAMIPMQITVGDRVVAKIGSVKDDPFGRLVYQAQMNLGLSEVWLSQVLAKTVADHSLTPEHIVAWANRLELYDDTTLLLQGVRAWFDKDYIKAIHVLVPQIERGLRRIVTDLGKPVTRAHRDVPGASLAINMGEILNDQDVVAALGSDLSLHFLALYADPRGRNLRNELVHGLLSASSMTAANTQWLIHTLFLFGAWKELAQKRR